MLVDLTYLGDGLEGPRWQAQPQALNSAIGSTQAETRALFVAAWNEQTGEGRSEADFDWVQRGGPPEEEEEG